MQSLDIGSFETSPGESVSSEARKAVTQVYDYDLFVIGSGPAGQRAAIQAAKLGKRVAMAEMKSVIGGACISTGTIPSKTLREAALHLSGYRERSIYGASYAVKHGITMADLLYRAELVIRNEIDVTQNQLQRNHVEMFNACAAFSGPHNLSLELSGNRGRREVSAEAIVISVGTQAPWTDLTSATAYLDSLVPTSAPDFRPGAIGLRLFAGNALATFGILLAGAGTPGD